MSRAQILYVDDDREGLHAFRLLFEEYYDVHTANSAAEAYEIVDQYTIELVLSDQRMPEVDGVSLLKRVMGTHPAIMRCLVTAHLDPTAMLSALNEARVHQIIAKPWKAEELKLVIDGALTHGRITRHNEQLLRDLETARAELDRREAQLTASVRAHERDATRWRAAIGAAPDGILLCDGEGTIIEANPAIERLFGYERTELIGQSTSLLVPRTRDGGEVVTPVGTDQTADGTPTLLRCTRKDGRTFVVEVAEQRLLDDGPPLTISAFRDVTARLQAEAQARALNAELELRVAQRTAELASANQALKEREETFRGVTTAAQSAIVMLGPDGCVRLWNRAAERIFGWMADEVIGRRLEAFMVPLDYGERHCAGFADFQETGHGPFLGVTVELVSRTKSGAEIPIEMSLSSVRQGDGYCAVGILNDITERQRAKLELIRARETAEKASKAKSEFLANMSHEIRTPMNAILGFSQLLQRDPLLASHHRTKVESIIRGGEHLLELINDVLEVSKIEAGQVVLTSVTFDVHDLLGHVEDMFRSAVESRGLALSSTISKLTPRLLEADAGKIRQILVNLVANAAKFTEAGSISVQANVTGIGQQMRLLLDVTDTGCGIRSDDMEHVFAKFTQTDAGRAKGGTGLGLAISREYARMMGGELSATSTDGVGTRFRLEVPVTIGRSEDVTPVATHRPVIGLDPGQPELRVLVVDDTVTNRYILAELLRSLGLTVRQAAGGLEALAVVKEWDASLAFIDLRMPGMDGFATARELKRQVATLKVIAMSASSSATDMRRAKDAGADDFLAKPLREAELVAAISGVTGVRFAFMEPTTGHAADKSVGQIDWPSTFAVVSAAEREQMRDAVAIGDVDRFLEILGGTGMEKPAANALRALAERFDYQAIHRLLDR